MFWGAARRGDRSASGDGGRVQGEAARRACVPHTIRGVDGARLLESSDCTTIERSHRGGEGHVRTSILVPRWLFGKASGLQGPRVQPSPLHPHESVRPIHVGSLQHMLLLSAQPTTPPTGNPPALRQACSRMGLNRQRTHPAARCNMDRRAGTDLTARWVVLTLKGPTSATTSTLLQPWSAHLYTNRNLLGSLCLRGGRSFDRHPPQFSLMPSACPFSTSLSTSLPF